MVDGFLVDELGSIEGVHIDPTVVLGQDEPLMVIGDGPCFIAIAVNCKTLEEFEIVEDVAVLVDIEP